MTVSTKVNQIWQDLGSKGYVFCASKGHDFCVTEPTLTNEGLLWVQPITPPVSRGLRESNALALGHPMAKPLGLLTIAIDGA